MKTTILNYFAWYGVIAILMAYILLSFAFLNSDSLVYQLLNLSGALGILLESAHKKNVQPVVLNIVWVIIALTAIGKILI